jgi:TRAP transporter TAXI family solute receptor
MKKSAAVALLVVLLASTPALPATRISVATGPWGGVFFRVGTSLAHLLSKHVHNATAVAEPVTGSAHGLELVDKGEATLALVSLSAAHFGVLGQREFTRKHDNVAFVMAAMDTGQSLVTLRDSGIKTFADVKDLRVAANTESSKAELFAALKLYGVREKNVRFRIMSFAEQLDALRDGTLEAGFIAISPYNRDVATFAAAQPIRILGFDAAQAKAFEEPPFWTPVGVRAGTYPGQERDLIVPGAHTTLLAYKQADPALIYQITKAIIDHGKEFGDLHPGGREFTAKKTRYFVDHHLVPVAFHPGAERYWRETGVLK